VHRELAGGTFINAGAGVKANLLFFTKGEHSERIWYYDLSDFTNRRHSEGRRFPGPRNPLLRRTKADSSVSLPRPEFTLSPRPPIGGSIVTRNSAQGMPLRRINKLRGKFLESPLSPRRPLRAVRSGRAKGLGMTMAPL